ncbi:hypothetical protein K474DRAFT_1557886, partial [Panus rudis PR-1116 ss-1]
NGTLGIADKIYVISLPNRLDRRRSMESLRLALSLDWTYLDATPSDSVAVEQIIEQVRGRRAYTTVEESQCPLFLSSIGANMDGLSLSQPSTSYAKSSPDTDHKTENLTCASENHLLGVPYNSSTPRHMLLTPGRVACWHSHLRTIHQIVSEAGFERNSTLPSDSLSEGGSTCRGVSIILEDDVDMESDIRDRLNTLWPSLPPNWDIVYFGHCWSNESFFPALPSAVKHPRNTLHPSRSPKCTHAYALSPKGARTVLRYLQYPPFAYSRALDQAMAWLILNKKINSYSIVPSIIAQRKVLLSDIDEGKAGFGSSWKDSLDRGVL